MEESTKSEEELNEEKLNENQDPSGDELLAEGLLQLYEPPLLQVKKQLKELIFKQNKIYVDITGEKFKFLDLNVSKVGELMLKTKTSKEKLIGIKKQMTAIHHRVQALKIRAQNIQLQKEQELAMKIQRQKQEEQLIARQEQRPTEGTT